VPGAPDTAAAPGTQSSSVTVALVETSDLLPGLLPFQAWDVLGTAEVVFARDAAAHPSAEQLHFAGLDLHTLEPAPLERGDLDLSRPGDPGDRRLAKSLVRHAQADGVAVYLLGPEDDRLSLALAGMAAEHDVEVELVFLAQQPPGTELLRLVEVLRRLRDPEGGCPWDLEQDHASLSRYLVEETYELVDAIEAGDDADLVEELGDVLLQVVFHAQVAADRRAFGIDDVARGISGKLVRRHPHVFADGDASTPEEVQARWDELKTQEKARSGPFDGVPQAGPGLDLLHTLDRKARRRGLLPPDRPSGAQAAAAALQALQEVGSPVPAADGPGQDDDGPADDPEPLIGRLLESVVALAADHGVDPEAAARRVARARRARTEAALQRLPEDVRAAEVVDPASWAAAWQDAGHGE